MASENRHPTGDTGTGAVIRPRRIRTGQDLVSDVSVTETDITAEAAVGEGAMVQTPTPPTKTDRKLGEAIRTNAKELVWRRWDVGLMGMGTSVGPAIGAHRRRWGQPFGAHRRDDILSRMGETSVWTGVRRPQEKVTTAVRRPQTKGKPPWGQPFGAHRRRWGQPSGVNRTLMRPAIAALTVRSAIGTHKILVSDAMRRSQ